LIGALPISPSRPAALHISQHTGPRSSGIGPLVSAQALVSPTVELQRKYPMRPSLALSSQRQQILALVAAAGASNLRVFGSVATGRDQDGSDVDLLINMPPGTSLLKIIGLQQDIEAALGVKVDMCTERELHPALRPSILAEARPL
jgi:predicted nucleotidyltransferase